MKHLYHVSPNKNMATIEPKRTLSKDTYIGDFVFATADIRYAAMYLTNKGLYKLMNAEASVPRIIISSDKDEYLRNDAGGAIYTVPAKDFIKTPQEELADTEFVSEKSVIPVRKKVYITSMDAMKEHGITVYFVDQDTFNAILKEKNDEEAITKLAPYSY